MRGRPLQLAKLHENQSVGTELRSIGDSVGLDGGVGDFRPWFEELKRLVPTK